MQKVRYLLTLVRQKVGACVRLGACNYARRTYHEGGLIGHDRHGGMEGHDPDGMLGFGTRGAAYEARLEATAAGLVAQHGLLALLHTETVFFGVHGLVSLYSEDHNDKVCV